MRGWTSNLSPHYRKERMIKLETTGAGIYGIYRAGQRIATAWLSKRYRPAQHIPVGYVITIRTKTGKRITEIARNIGEAEQKLKERKRW